MAGDRTTDGANKERRGTALLGELLLKLGQRESLRDKLAELEDRLGSAALDQVLDRLEKIVAEMAVPVTPPPPARERPKSTIPDPALKDPFADLLANINLPSVDQEPGTPPAAKPASKEKERQPPTAPAIPRETRVEKTAPPAPPPEAPAEKKAPKEEKKETPPSSKPEPPPSPKPEAPKVVLPPGLFRKPETAKEKLPELPPRPAEKKVEDFSAFLPKPILLRSKYPLEPEDVLYLHAVAQIPVEEKAAPEPFILEEKGFESKEFVFALDRGGLRFYLSRLTAKTTNVSKTGMFLLNRKESIHLRGTHYSILNDLRVYGLLLPFEFGSVALGIDDLHAKIDEHVYELRDGLEEIVATRWWEVCVYGLDQKMMEFVAPDGPTSQRGERDRRGGDRSRTTGSRIDIKTLERVLNKQKSLAEEIHHRLESLSSRSDVDMMVGLSSGSSDDWKPILRASYDVASPAIYRFNHAINDLQYHHLKYQLMFVLTGDREDYSFQQS